MTTRKERRERRTALTERLRTMPPVPGQTKARRDPVGFQAELTARVHRQRMREETDDR